ncbi:thiamine biosynthesis protein ThiJ [Prevotella pectinovora]|uniref:DJ-1 family glyoxalase III n=1 Tax=Prevotella pectinovora TaxID=1602169 RepID=UPI0005B714A0|nr:DJ-1 family glyoxalase III [Prevotella pectinovora]KIP58756.1 thiamine biosynthesis protein ThiJ [Prevotella pectinovora]
MAKAYMFLANGSEEIESLIPVDVFRRGGVEIKTVSITGSELVEMAHGVTVKADLKFEDAKLEDADLLMLPGGLPGATNLNDHEGVRNAVLSQYEKGKLVAAICAAPMVFGSLGIVKGRRATCYPGFEKYLDGAEYTHELCTVDGNVVTGEGPAATFPYAYTLLEMLTTKQTAESVAEGMMYLHLMKNK